MRAWGAREGLESGETWGQASVLKDLSGHGVEGGQMEESKVAPISPKPGRPVFYRASGVCEWCRAQRLRNKGEVENTEDKDG